MSTLEDLAKRMSQQKAKRAAVARLKNAERKSWYFSPFYMPAKEKEMVNFANAALIEKAFENHQHEVALEILGTLCNLKRIGGGGQEGGTIGPDHQAAIKLVRTWYLKAKAYDAVVGDSDSK